MIEISIGKDNFLPFLPITLKRISFATVSPSLITASNSCFLLA
jgi:hypothetical protein